MQRGQRLERLQLAFLAGFMAVGLMLLVWGIIREPVLTGRDDNPRTVETELRIQRGRILDSNNEIVAETVGPAGALQRLYPLPFIGPAVGYYSFRHGTAGVEESYDQFLRGDNGNFWVGAWQRAIHQLPSGRDIRLTLDSDWQGVADALLGQHQGAAILLTLPDGAIRAMASHPAYDPNTLNENFESLVADAQAPLLNRATQSQYQPGLIIQPFLLAAAVESGLINLQAEVAEATRPVVVGSFVRECAGRPPQPTTWADVLQQGCPYPMTQLGEMLGKEQLNQLFDQFGLTQQPGLPLATAETPPQPVQDLWLASLGQENLTVSPLQVALALGGLANQGQLPSPQLVEAVQDQNGDWQAISRPPAGEAVFPAGSLAVLAALPRHEGTLIEYATLALSGPAGTTTGWYLGLAPAGNPRYLLVIALENSPNLFEAQQIGRAFLNHILGISE